MPHAAVRSAADDEDNEVYGFACEWQDPVSGLTKDIRMLYYTADNSIELFDVKFKKLFLKRAQYPDIGLKDISLGSQVNILSRILNVVDYADDSTRKRLSQRLQSGAVIVGLTQLGGLLDKLQGFTVNNIRLFQLSAADIQDFASSTGVPSSVLKPSQPFVVLHVAKESCIDLLNEISKNETLLFKAANETVASKVAEFFFASTQRFPRTARFHGSTLVLIKPHILTGEHQATGQIIDAILKKGYVINDLQKFKMSRINAEEFTEIYRKVIPQYHEVVDQLISGPVLAMEVTAGPRMQFKNIDDPSDPQANLVSSFRYFTGPLDPKTARQVRPESLRARFGSDTVRNAIHCTDLAEDAQLEVEYFFQILAIQ